MVYPTLVPTEDSIGITVFYNRAEGWLNVLTCTIGAGVYDLRPISVEVFSFTEDLLGQWIRRAAFEPSIYLFSCQRTV